MSKTVFCPECGVLVWDVATIDQALNKCWGCGLRFMNDIDDEEVMPVPDNMTEDEWQEVLARPEPIESNQLNKEIKHGIQKANL